MGFRADFRLFKRTLPSGKKVYYYYIYDDFGKRKQFSTGHTIKNKAFQFCLDKLKKDSLNRASIPTFQALTKDFFVYDKCPIVKQKIIRGERFSRSNIDNQRSYLQNIFNPIFGNMLINKISEHTIESFISVMIDRSYSPNSINNYLASLRNIFNYALSKKIIRENPMNLIKPLKSNVIRNMSR